MTRAPRHLVVVPHTHWDREWYRTHEEFRYRLVRLVDRLLDLLEGDPGFRHFTLDGQTIVLDDYLEVRPGARERIAKLVRAGRLVIGPWHVLPDEWLVSGEALIRNLRLGLRKAGELGTPMALGYVPDQFGHVGQLPQVFAGFGFDAAVLWRGVGADVESTPFWWEGVDGTRLLTVYLPSGYGNAAQLPLEREALVTRLRLAVGSAERFARTPSLLLMNGSDHLEPQPGLPAALETAVAELPGVSAEIGTLPGFVRRLRTELPPDLPEHRGELRSGLRAPLLPGCASARSPQKRAEAANDHLLIRWLEPLCAWLGALGGDPDPGILDLAWRVALENHPHDSVCGCSIDRVHDQMDVRFRRVEEIATAHLRQVASALGAKVALPAEGFGPGAGQGLFVWNPNGGGRCVVDSEVALDLEAGSGRIGPFHLRDARGNRIPAHAERVAPGREFFRTRLPAAVAPLILGALRADEFAGHSIQEARWRIRDRRLSLEVLLSEAPSGFDVAGLRHALESAMAQPEVEEFAVVARTLPRVRLRFADDLPGHGLRVYRVARGRAAGRSAPALASWKTADGGGYIENACWRVEADAAGRVRLRHRESGTVIEDALRVVSEGDRGDEYNFDPVAGDVAPQRLERVRVAVERGGEASAALALDGRLRVPVGLTADRSARAAREVALPVRIGLRLFAGVDRVDVEVSLSNTAQDHRLRLHLRAPFEARRFEVESAFEIAERPIAPAPDAFGSKAPAEFPIGAVPQRSFASLDDGAWALCVANRGSAEVEALPASEGAGSELAVTLLRAVGWLSRDDLVLRPGHAGPPLPTPGAQVPGPHRAELCLRLHRVADAGRVRAAHDFAAPPLAVVGGGGPDGPLRDGDRLVEVDDSQVVVTALEPRADGQPQIRLLNASAERRRARVRWRGPGAVRLELVDLAERPAAPGPHVLDGVEARLDLRPWEIVTLRPH